MSYYYSVPKGNQISIGWEDETKDTVFGGVSWSGHFADVSACRESDARIEELESRLDGERATRDQNRTQLSARVAPATRAKCVLMAAFLEKELTIGWILWPPF